MSNKVQIDLEGIKPIPDDQIELNQECDFIKEFGVDGIRGIGESWSDYYKSMMFFRSGELVDLRRKALKESTRKLV